MLQQGWGLTVVLGIHPSPRMLPLHPMELFDGRRIVGSVFGDFKGKTQLPQFVHECMRGVSLSLSLFSLFYFWIWNSQLMNMHSIKVKRALLIWGILKGKIAFNLRCLEYNGEFKILGGEVGWIYNPRAPFQQDKWSFPIACWWKILKVPSSPLKLSWGPYYFFIYWWITTGLLCAVITSMYALCLWCLLAYSVNAGIWLRFLFPSIVPIFPSIRLR